jgi:hypothetical protein
MDKDISCRPVAEVLQNSATRLENKDLRRGAVVTDIKTAGKTQKAARSAGQSSPKPRGGANFDGWRGQSDRLVCCRKGRPAIKRECGVMERKTSDGPGGARRERRRTNGAITRDNWMLCRSAVFTPAVKAMRPIAWAVLTPAPKAGTTGWRGQSDCLLCCRKGRPAIKRGCGMMERKTSDGPDGARRVRCRTHGAITRGKCALCHRAVFTPAMKATLPVAWAVLTPAPVVVLCRPGRLPPGLRFAVFFFVAFLFLCRFLGRFWFFGRLGRRVFFRGGLLFCAGGAAGGAAFGGGVGFAVGDEAEG